MATLIETQADQEVRECLAAGQSFALIAGAGAGKTTSLIGALRRIRDQYGAKLKQNGQRVACITYTKRAVEVIRSRLGFDELYEVSTLHSFVWSEFSRFTNDIREALVESIIPEAIAKARAKDNGRDTKEARKARDKVVRLEAQLAGVGAVSSFKYDDSAYSDYQAGLIGHDDVIKIAGYLMANKAKFRKLLGLRYPYIFVDEAQDTYGSIMAGLNLICGEEGLPLVGYFGDDWQQIYEERAGTVVPPAGGRTITKTENFRCSVSVIEFLNRFRTDLVQAAAGPNREVAGSVEMALIQSEEPENQRRYSPAQVERSLARMDAAMTHWEWNDRADIMKLYLVRQMIARRLGFPELNKLFTGNFASQSAQDDYESGEHFALKPFVAILSPLMASVTEGDTRKAIDLLRANSPTFDINGANSKRSLKEMIDLSKVIIGELGDRWANGSVRDVLGYCREQGLIDVSRRLSEHLERGARAEEYDEDLHSEVKSDWLMDQFFGMSLGEVERYCKFIQKNSAFSTQHGVKGEEYPNVLVVFDDVEAAWSQYSFIKLLTPRTAGNPTEGQEGRGRKLAYVSFSRAGEHLRIVLYTPNPEAARQEIIDRGLLTDQQISLFA